MKISAIRSQIVALLADQPLADTAENPNAIRPIVTLEVVHPICLGAGTTAEIEEERRLLYVAMTRARDDLLFVVPQRFFSHGQDAQGDRHVYASRTRFIPDELLGLFERVHGRRLSLNWPREARANACGSISRLACAACGDEDQISNVAPRGGEPGNGP